MTRRPLDPISEAGHNWLYDQDPLPNLFAFLAASLKLLCLVILIITALAFLGCAPGQQ